MTFQIQKNTSEITEPIHLKFESVQKKSIENKQTIYINKQHLVFPLQLRKWQNGDFFYPSGMAGKKKLSKYFKDEKISILEKQNIWILCNNNDEIIWVVNHRQDNRFIAKEATKDLFKITIIS
jgi:tRNA(Ile)-lysidine synthase